jgi:hypothetical protein
MAYLILRRREVIPGFYLHESRKVVSSQDSESCGEKQGYEVN